jgi:hypothetical protein
MKKIIITSLLILLVAVGSTALAQNRTEEYLGLPGDNLNLYAVMNLFQESKTLEDFERTLNDENSRINNLDLNGDNLIDYIMVTDHVDGDVHNIVLQVAINQNERQDVAVFTVQRFRDGSVQIQLIGDEALYGRNYIIEPIYDDVSGDTPNPGYTERPVYSGNYNIVRTTPFEIASWPLIRFIYLPGYISWHSSWNWGYYPSYWQPWRPFYWDYYYGYHYNWFPTYYSHYRHWQNYRYARYNDFYYRGIRSYSHQVNMRIRGGDYRTTYSHPEQRRDGEALYSRTHSGQNSRSYDAARRSDNSTTGRLRTYPSSGQNTGISRRSSATVNNRMGTNPSSGQNTGISRRSTTTVNNRTLTNPSSGQNTSISRRSGTTVNNRMGTNPSSGQNTGISRRSATTVNNRTVTNPSSGQNNGISRRSATTVNNRTVTNPSSDQNAGNYRRSTPAISDRAASRPEQSQMRETVRAPRQSTTGISSSGRRSSNENRSGTVSKRSSSSNKSDNSRSSRRK